MIFRVEWCENKNPNWKVATLVEAVEGGMTLTDVSINRTDRDGSIAFPNFDEFAPGMTVEGNPWQNKTNGRWTLYPNRPAPRNDAEVTARNTAPVSLPTRPSYVPRGGPSAAMAVKAANIEVAQERKNESIREAQENKGNAIKVAAAMRDSTLIAIALMERDPDANTGDFMASFTRIKDWYLSEWDKTEKKLEIPF